VAREWTGDVPQAPVAPGTKAQDNVQLKAKKPSGHSH